MDAFDAWAGRGCFSANAHALAERQKAAMRLVPTTTGGRDEAL